MMADRMPPLPESSWDEAQTVAAQEVMAGPRKGLIAPFVPLLRSPELLTHAQRMGAYLRYRSALTLRLSELVILINARLWDQPVEWAIHATIAAEAGLAADSIEAISQGRWPANLAEDEGIVYGFSMELHQHKAVSDATWAQALALLGEQGVVDLIGLNGYYSFLAMTMNACRTPVPAGATSVLPALK